MKGYTVYNSNVPAIVAQTQKKVFEKFGMQIEQHCGSISHWDYIDSIIDTSKEDVLIFWDIDAIPLQAGVHDYLTNIVKKYECLIGCEQQASHLPQKHRYAGPCCMAFSRELWIKAGRPSMHPTERSDTAEELTWHCEERGLPIKMIEISHVEQPQWAIRNTFFGKGTTYGNMIYHQFEARTGFDLFLNKCEKVLQS